MTEEKHTERFGVFFLGKVVYVPLSLRLIDQLVLLVPLFYCCSDWLKLAFDTVIVRCPFQKNNNIG